VPYVSGFSGSGFLTGLAGPVLWLEIDQATISGGEYAGSMWAMNMVTIVSTANFDPGFFQHLL
jgi:hypothetical protein